jgi:hypothetical protein
MRPERGHRATYEPCGPKRTSVAQAGSSYPSFKGFRGHFDQCHLLDSGESLSALWIARYLPSGADRQRALGALGSLLSPIPQQRRERRFSILGMWYIYHSTLKYSEYCPRYGLKP